MGGLKTIVLTICIAVSAAIASASTANLQLRNFANCVGRMTAELEHAWLMNDSDAALLEQQRSQVAELLAAIMPRDLGRTVLGWRVDARAAQRALLMQASFASDADDAEWAASTAAQYRADCTGFLLS